MIPLQNIIEQYRLYSNQSRFISDYTGERDRMLAESNLPITLENLDAIMPRIIDSLRLRVATLKAA